MSHLQLLLLLLLGVIAGGAHGQAPTGYTTVADNDFIDAGPLTSLWQNITSLQACADACSQDDLCQSFQLSPFCVLYRLRRCMTPDVHDNPFPNDNKGPIYEKNSPVAIPPGFRIVTICGSYKGALIDTSRTTVPNDGFGPALLDNVANFTNNCSLRCSSMTAPPCRSWSVLEVWENNVHTPVMLQCSTYADSIYDGPSRGRFSVLNGACKRASSTYGINGAATSLLNCTGSGPGIGADPGPATPSPTLGDLTPGTGPDTGIVSAPGPSASGPMTATTMASSSPVMNSNTSNVGANATATSGASSASSPAAIVFAALSAVLAVFA